MNLLVSSLHIPDTRKPRSSANYRLSNSTAEGRIRIKVSDSQLQTFPIHLGSSLENKIIKSIIARVLQHLAILSCTAPVHFEQSAKANVRPHFDLKANFPGYILTTGLGRGFNMDSSSEGEQWQDATELGLTRMFISYVM